MTQASVTIAQQYKDGGVVGASLEGQSTVSKKYVDDQLAIRDTNIASAASAAGNAQTEVDQLEVRVDNIVANAGSSNTEIVDARQPAVGTAYPNLKTRLDASDSRLFGGPVNVLYPPPPLVGAKGDGITDDTAAIQGAVNLGRKVIIPYTSTGYKIETGGILLQDNTEIEGENQVTIHCTGNYLFLVQAVGCRISNLKIDMDGAPSSSMAIRLVTAAKVCWFIRISKIQFLNCYKAIHDDADTLNYVVDLQVVDCNCMYTKGVQFYIHHSRGFITFRETVVDQTLNTSPVTWIGAAFEDFVGLELEKFDVVGPVSSRVTPAYSSSQIGIYMKGSTTGKASVWLTRVLVDNTMGDGIYIENVLNLVINNLEVYQCLGSPMTFKDLTVVQGTNLFVVGGKGLTGAVDGANGIVFNNCTKMAISNLKSSDNTGHGVSIFNSTDNQFSNVQIDNNKAFGWVESGTSNRNITTNANINGNGNGIIQSGAASAINHWLLNGAYRPHDVGAVSL